MNREATIHGKIATLSKLDKEYVLRGSSGSVLVRWSAHEETDWEGNKEKRKAYIQRIALQTEVKYIDNE